MHALFYYINDFIVTQDKRVRGVSSHDALSMREGGLPVEPERDEGRGTTITFLAWNSTETLS